MLKLIGACTKRVTPTGLSILLLFVGLGFVATQRVAEGAPPPPRDYWASTPERVLDTRACDEYLTPWCSGRLLAATRLVVQTGAPDGTVAVAVNITITDTLGYNFLTAWEGGATPKPVASIINSSEPGQTVANFVMVPVLDDGTFVIEAYAPVHVIVDVMGVQAPTPPAPMGTRTLTIDVLTSGGYDATGEEVTIWIECQDRAAVRHDFESGGQNIHPGTGQVVSFFFDIPTDLQTNCAVGFSPRGDVSQSWWGYVVDITTTINGTTFTGGTAVECLMADSWGTYDLRPGDNPAYVDGSSPTDCDVVFTIHFAD